MLDVREVNADNIPAHVGSGRHFFVQTDIRSRPRYNSGIRCLFCGMGWEDDMWYGDNQCIKIILANIHIFRMRIGE